MKIEVTEIAGLKSALESLHLPFNGECKSDVHYEQSYDASRNYFSYGCHGFVAFKDLDLLQTLRARGDEHAKVLRGVQVWLKITAPIYFWWDLETYVVGHQRLCSESTMHSECRGLSGEELQKVKGDIPFGREITKIDMFSYQTLSRIHAQRINHRLPEFEEFCKFIETLPYYEELIKPIDHKAIINEKMINKAVKWLRDELSTQETTAPRYPTDVVSRSYYTAEELIEEFSKYMKGGNE